MKIGGTARTRTAAGVLEDNVYMSPVDEYQARYRRRATVLSVFCLLALFALVYGYFNFDRPEDFDDVVEQFKYGSIGSETGGSVLYPAGGYVPPYWIFMTMPEVCSDLLPPGGLEAVGLIMEEGRDRPIGISRRRRLGMDEVGLNCAVCHTGTVRETDLSEPVVYAGMPANQLDMQALIAFLLACGQDERLTYDAVRRHTRENDGRIGFVERLIYRAQLLGPGKQVDQRSVAMTEQIGMILGDEVTPWGRGRVDTFNPYKALQFNWNLSKLPHDELLGASDFPSIWNQAPREGMHLHWDGNNESVDERNLSASLGAGVTPVSIDHPRLDRVKDWIWELPPPEYPFAIDDALAARGEPIYERQCASCHAFDGADVGTVVDIDDIGTDPFRLNSYTYLFSVNQYALYPNSEYQFKHFKKTNGYANQPLDGIWLRAPYLHNGSVPTLRALLDPPAERPTTFFRGYDVYDQADVGFVHDEPSEGELKFSEYDTALPGNGNGGHEYGLGLSEDDIEALLEYMKTL